MKTGVIRTLLQRSRRICNSEEAATKVTRHIQKVFGNNGYPTNLVYVGETGRTLNVRQKEHKRHLFNGNVKDSAVAAHAHQELHDIDWENTFVLNYDDDFFKREVKEALLGKRTTSIRTVAWQLAYLVITFVKINTFVCSQYMSLTLLVIITHYIGINSLLCVPFSQLPGEDYQSIIKTLQIKILPTTVRGGERYLRLGGGGGAPTIDNTVRLASFPGLPRFCSSVFVQYNTRKRNSAKNGEGLGTPIT